MLPWLTTRTSLLFALQTIPITETRTVPAGGPGTRTGQVTCSIHGYEGDFVEATAFCCTMGQGRGNYNYGPGYETGSSYASYDSYESHGKGGDDGYDGYETAPYGAAGGQPQATAGAAPAQKGQPNRAGVRKQTGAQAVQDAAALPSGGLNAGAVPSMAAGSTSTGQAPQAAQHGQYLEPSRGAPVQQPAPAAQQQRRPPQAWGSGGQAGGSSASTAPTAGEAGVPANAGMGGFALRRAKKALSPGGAGVRGVAAVAGSVSAADDLKDLQEKQQTGQQEQQKQGQQQQQNSGQQEQQKAGQQEQQQVVSFWAPEPQAASPDLFVTSRATALKEALEKAQH